MNIWVTGIGVASSIGLNVEQSLDSFRKEKRGLGEISILETIHRSEFKAGEVSLNNQQLMELLEIPMSRYKTSETGAS